MTQQEVLKLLAVIRVAYPGWQRGQEAAAAKLWGKALADIDANAAASAMHEHITQNKFAPTIAEIRDGAQKEASRFLFVHPAPVFFDGAEKRRLK